MEGKLHFANSILVIKSHDHLFPQAYFIAARFLITNERLRKQND